MQEEKHKKNWFKFAIGFVLCLIFRLIPFRPPNIEPVLATQMPFAKAYGKLAGFSFAFFGMILYDIVTGKIGMWTFTTATAYGLLGIWAFTYFKNKKSSPLNYAKFAIMSTLAFDAVTGLSTGPLFFQQPFMGALLGQIPFTFWHLVGNISFALVLSPAIYKIVTKPKKQETMTPINILSPKII